MTIKGILMFLMLALAVTGWGAKPALAASAQVTVKGSSLYSYTVELWQNGNLIARKTDFTTPAGVKTMTWNGVSSGCGYIANVYVNGIGVQSHTWPSKCVNGTTLLGCLAFNIAGEPTPWIGDCRVYP